MQNDDICAAVLATVSEYGLQKTTMSDIAAAAKVSRQTLYNIYANKEEALQAAVKYSIKEDLKELEAQWVELDDFSTKLDLYFKCGPLKWYDQTQALPKALDLMEGLADTIEPAIKEGHNEWIDFLCVFFQQNMELEKARTLADFVFSTAKNAKYSAINRDQLISRLDLLKEMVCTTYLSR